MTTSSRIEGQGAPETKGQAPRTVEIPNTDNPQIRALQDLLVAALETPMTEIPTKIQVPSSFETILQYVQAGGRLPGIDYNTLDSAEKVVAFAAAREILNRPMYSNIAGEDWVDESDANMAYHHPNPNDPSEKFGAINPLKTSAVDALMAKVTESKNVDLYNWDGHDNLDARIALLDRVAARMCKENNVYGALLALSLGKSGNESLRESQEFYDFTNNYRDLPHALALQQVMLRSGGDTQLGIRPFDKPVGVWQPFNFPCIGSGDVLSALMTGNTVVVHTSARAAGVYKWFHDICLAEGVPARRLHFVVPHGDSEEEKNIDSSMSRALAEHPDLGNIYFTGSLGVATKLAKSQEEKGAAQKRLDIKLHAEAGGYNTMSFIGLPQGALEAFADGVPNSDSEWDAFLQALPKDSFLAGLSEALEDSSCGLQGHKCSALSEMIFALDPSGKDGLTQNQIDVLVAFTVAIMNRVKIGDVNENPDVRMGSLIDQAMKVRVGQQMKEILARDGARILTGDGTLQERLTVDRLPNAIKPIVYIDPNRKHGEDAEIFAPVFRIHVVPGGSAGAIARVQEIPYGLTGAVCASELGSAKAFRRRMPAGVAYPSSGIYTPTTTAAPAPQIPFGGIKGSGTGTGLLRPGTALHPLLFADVISEANQARVDWGKGLEQDPVIAALESLLAIQGIRNDFRSRLSAVSGNTD